MLFNKIKSIELNKLLKHQIQEHIGANDELTPEKFHSLLQVISESYDQYEKDREKQKRAELAIGESENKYRGLFEKMVDGVYKSSHEGKFIEVNPALVTMLGYDSKEELLAIDIKSSLYFDTSDREDAVLQDKTDGTAVFRLKKKDGSGIWVEDRGQYVSDAEGNILYHEGTLRDVTERVKADELLKARNAELTKSNSELDKFVYSVSHDLRAPLSSIMGIVEITEEETQDKLVLEHLSLVKGSIKRLDGFIMDILEYSRNSRLELKKENINFREILDTITENLKFMGGSNSKIKITIDIANEKQFVSDKIRINSVLNNLISNSIRYHNPEIKDPFVNIKIDMSDTETNIIVKDNGIGISKENIDKVFEMFYRVAENSVGSGLGLYIVRETIGKLNGQIKVESEPGVGTMFHLNIPNLNEN